jgi:hypothetical protein
MCSWFCSFLLKAFVSRVNRRVLIRIVKFARPPIDKRDNSVGGRTVETSHTASQPSRSSAQALADVRTAKNGRHRLAGLLRQSVFERPGHEDLNDADRLCLC